MAKQVRVDLFGGPKPFARGGRAGWSAADEGNRGTRLREKSLAALPCVAEGGGRGGPGGGDHVSRRVEHELLLNEPASDG